MKKDVLLIGSVAANAILLGVVALLVASRPVEPISSPTESSRQYPAGTRPGIRSGSDAGAIRWNDSLNKPLPALGITGGDEATGGTSISLPAGFADLVQRLRSMGVAEETVAGLVSAEFSRQWQERNRQLQRAIRRGELDPEARKEFGMSYQEDFEKAMRSALGDEAYERWDKHNMLRNVDLEELGLSSTDMDALYQAKKDQQRRSQELSRLQQAGEIDPYDYQQQQSALQKENEEKLSEVLGSDRYSKYKQGGDWGYTNLRGDLRGMSVSDAQIDSLYKTMKSFDDQRRELSLQSQAGKKIDGKTWQQLQTQQEDEFRRILGEQGYADYKKSQDYRYKQMKQYAPAWKLSANDIDQVYHVLKEYQTSIQDYRNEAKSSGGKSGQVNWLEVQQNIKVFTQQTETDLRRYLGDDRYERMKRAGVIQLSH